MKKTIIIAAAFLAILVAGCSSIDSIRAESVAEAFVKSNVRFFAVENNSTVGIPNVKISDIKSYYINSKWEVTMHAFATFGNETKQSDISVSIDRKGNVLALNGKMIPKDR